MDHSDSKQVEPETIVHTASVYENESTHDGDPEPPHTAPPHLWVEHYGDFLFRYALSRLGESTAAEEAVQETFLAGIKHLHQYTGAGPQRAWLLGILKRKIIDLVRKREKHQRTGTYDEPDPSNQLFDDGGHWRKDVPWSKLPESQIESQELWDVVRGCLNHLPQGQADAFVLSVIEEMDSTTICEELEITPSNLWVRLHRARLGLAQCVGGQWGGPRSD